MSDIATASELGQVLTAIQALQGDIKDIRTDQKTMQADLQEFRQNVGITLARTDERLNSIEEKIEFKFKGLDEKVEDIRSQQKTLMLDSGDLSWH